MCERRGLLKLITPTAGNLTVLIVESASYVEELRSMMPNATIHIVNQNDYNAFNDGTFDLIVGEDVFTLSNEPYDTLRDLGQLLTDVGTLITQYHNIRYIEVLDQLRQGFYPERRRRLYAKPEVVRLLNDAHFKQINFTPDSIATFDVSEWIDFGFDNFSDDLNVKTWLIKAGRSTDEVAALKGCFTPSIRAELSKLIHRIEYDIDREENFERLFKLCRREMVFDEYLSDFIRSVVAHRDRWELFTEAAANYGIELELNDIE